MELWDLYNERRELTGRDHIRGEEVPQASTTWLYISGFGTVKVNI